MTMNMDSDLRAEKALLDSRNLMREAFAIEGIDIWQCRSIFLDWALGWPVDTHTRPHVERLLVIYGADAPDHPMTQVLKAAMEAPKEPKRRGGRKARVPE